MSVESPVSDPLSLANPSLTEWFMREVMPSNPDDSPVARELREVFHLD